VSATDISAGQGHEGPIVMELDEDLRHVSASDAALAMVGLPAEELMGRTPSEAGLPPEVVEPLERELRQAVATRRERRLELEMPTADGVRWLSLRLVPGSPAGPVTVLAEDVTERKHAELRLSGGHSAFRVLVEESLDPIARIDADMRISFVNLAFELATGRPAAELLGRAVTEAVVAPGIAERWEEGAREVFADGDPLALDFRFPTPDGPRWYSARLLPEPGEHGRPAHVILACTDITDRVNREAEQAALRRVATVVAREGDLAEIGRVVAQESALLLSASGSAVYRFEPGGTATCIAAHPPAAEGSDVPASVPLSGSTATGRTAETGLPARVDDYLAEPADDSIRDVLEAGLRSAIAAPLSAGGRLWGALTAGSGEPHAFGDADERRLAAFGELAAVAVANAEARAELAHLADTDPLTGLANRRAFTARLNGEVQRARRHGHRLTLAILDLDDFKSINDTHGHQTGDRVLAEVGRRLQSTCRAGELVARIGGEEFAWILPEVDAAGSRPAVERARAEIAGVVVDGVSGITCSAGVCDLESARDVDDLLRRADRALYGAKRAGRDRVEAAAGEP
jgi:diguanylate cyclase (GGDEF)-like protein/PAS domain S-box-containing protein